MKLAAMGTMAMMPGASAATHALGTLHVPKLAPMKAMSNINPWEVKHMAATATPATMTAATIPAPRRGTVIAPSGVPKMAHVLQAFQSPAVLEKLAIFGAIPGALLGADKGARHGEAGQGALRGGAGAGLGGVTGASLGALLGTIGGEEAVAPAALLGGALGSLGGYKLLTRKYNKEPGEKKAHELTPEGRSHIKSKNFAVSAQASNTGAPAYPIQDRQHAISALGFAKMHHDSKDLAEVRKDVAAKYPDLVKKGGAAETLGTIAGGVAGHLGMGVLHDHVNMSPMMQAVGTGLAAAGAGAAAAHVKKKLQKHARVASELLKNAGLLQRVGEAVKDGPGMHKMELAGLGILAAPSVDSAQAHIRAAASGNYNKDEVKKREILPAAAKPVSEIAGLGVLAGPSAAHLLKH